MNNEVVSVPRLDPVYTGLLGDMQNVVSEIVQERDFERGFQVINNLLVQGKALDDSVGMLLNGMNEVWLPTEHEGEKFGQAVLRNTGLKPVTVYRHLKIQKALPLIPEQFREEIQEKGQKEKIRIAELVVGGYEVQEDDWRDLAEAVDEKEVGRIARKVKNEEPRSNWLAISIDDNGKLMVHTVRGHFELGRLYVHDDNPDVQKAIARLTGCSGVQPSAEY